MLRRLSIGLLASAIALAPLPTKAQEGTAEDLSPPESFSGVARREEGEREKREREKRERPIKPNCLASPGTLLQPARKVERRRGRREGGNKKKF